MSQMQFPSFSLLSHFVDHVAFFMAYFPTDDCIPKFNQNVRSSSDILFLYGLILTVQMYQIEIKVL